MKSSIISAIQHIRIADEFMEDVIRSGNTIGAKIFKGYSAKLKYIVRDFTTYPFFNEYVREGIRQEIKTDPLVTEGIKEKIALLPAQYREDFEQALEWILDGKTVKITMDDTQGKI